MDKAEEIYQQLTGVDLDMRAAFGMNAGKAIMENILFFGNCFLECREAVKY